MDGEKLESPMKRAKRGKTKKPPGQQAVKSYRTRTRGKALKMLFGLFKSKRSKTVTPKKNERRGFSKTFDKDNVLSTQKLSSYGKKTLQVRTESAKETSVTEGEKNKPNKLNCNRLTSVTPSKRHERLLRSPTRKSIIQDLLIEFDLTEAFNSDLISEAMQKGENNDRDFFEGSYFEDEYWSPNDQYDEEDDEYIFPLFSTPAKPISLHDRCQRVHMGVSSLRSGRRNKTFPTDSVKNIGNHHLSLPNGLNNDDQDVSPLKNLEVSKRDPRTNEQVIEMKKFLTDEDIRNLPALHPTIGHKFVFGDAPDESSFCVDVEILDSTDGECKDRNTNSKDNSKYKLRKPEGMTVDTSQHNCNITSRNTSTAASPFSAHKTESGYDSCEKTPLLKIPTANVTTPTSSTPVSSSPLPPFSFILCHKSAIFAKESSASDNKDQPGAIGKNQESGVTTCTLKNHCSEHAKSDVKQADKQSKIKELERPKMNEKRSPVKRSLFSSSNRDPVSPISENVPNETITKEVQNQPNVQEEINGNNKHSPFNLNSFLESLIDQPDEPVPNSSLRPMTSSPIQININKSFEELDILSLTKSKGDIYGMKRPASPIKSNENEQKCSALKKRCRRPQKYIKYSTSKDTNSSSLEHKRLKNRKKTSPVFYLANSRSKCSSSNEDSSGRKRDVNIKDILLSIDNRRPDSRRISSSDEDDCPTTASPPKEYLLLKTSAETVLKRIPLGSCMRKELDIKRVMDFLYSKYRHHLSHYLSPASKPLKEKLDQPDSTKYPRSLSELKEQLQEQFRKPFEPTQKTFIDILLLALLADRKDVVDKCCNFAFSNILDLRTNRRFLACPPELVLMILSYKHSMILGTHGFPCSYNMAEWEVYVVAQYYTYKGRYKDSKTGNNFLSLVRSASDQRVRKEYLKSLLREGFNEDEKRLTSLFNKPRVIKKPCRDFYSFQYYSAKCACTEQNESPVGDTDGDKKCGIEPEIGRKADNQQLKVELKSNCLSGQVPNCETSRLLSQRDQSKILEVFTGTHMLREVWCAVEIRKGVPYITGLRFHYLYGKALKTVRVGDFELEKLSQLMQGATSRVEPYKPPGQGSRAQSGATSSTETNPDEQCLESEASNQRPQHRGTSVREDEMGSNKKSYASRVKIPLHLNNGEHIVEVQVQCTTALHNLFFITNLGRHNKVHCYGEDQFEWTKVKQPDSLRQPAAMANSCRFPCCLQTICADTKITESPAAEVSLCNLEFVWATVEKPHPQI